MPSPFHGIELSSRALRAFQRGLDVTGHNIANVNTRGYSRQTVDFVQTDPTTFFGVTAITLGTGVGISQVNRIRDIFLDNRMFQVSGEAGRFGTLSSGLSQVEPVFNDVGNNGIASSLNAFFNAWSDLASNPNQPAALMSVQQAGQSLATKIRSAHRDLQSIRTQFNSEMGQTLQDVDRLAQKIYDLNVEIRSRTVSGETPGDLFDQRDLAIEDLSKLADVSIQRKNDGSISVFLNGFTLVDDVRTYEVPKTFDPSTYTITDGAKTIRVDGGRLYGLMEASNRVAAYQSDLDLLANTLRTEINAAHMSGINSNGTTGIQFFNDASPQTGAGDFDLSAEVRADIRNIAAGTSGSAGDGGLAMAMSQMRDASSTLLGGRKYSAFYAEVIAGVGRDIQSAKAHLETKNAVLNQIDMQRQSISGVSIDDEMANMLRFQRSYQAAARALSVFNEVTEDLINLI